MTNESDAFEELDWDREIDVQQHINACPEDSMMRGMYTSPVVALALKQSGQRFGRERYVAFKFYPMKEHLQVVADCAKAIYPSLNLGRALRELGTMAVPTLRGSMVGRTMFALSGGTVESAFQLLAKGQAQARNSGGVRLLECSSTHAVFTMRKIIDFPMSLQVGIVENSAREAIGVKPSIKVKQFAFGDIDLRLEWNEGLIDARGKRISQ